MADFGLDVRDVSGLAGAVDDDEDVAAVGMVTVEEHQVVDDAAIIVQQQAVALPARRQADHVDRHQAFKGGRRIRPDQPQLAHVRHVEQAGGVAGMQMLGHQAVRVLHRHGITGKRHHARAEFHMQIIQRRVEQGGRGG